MTIGDRLRQERVRLGLAQPAFAALGGVLKGAQIAYESDKSSPTAAHLAAAAAEGLDVLYVVTGRREPKAIHQITEAPGPGYAAQVVTHSPAAPTHPGGLSGGAGGGLLAPADVSVARPMTLPVTFSAGGAYREYQVIPRLRAQAAAGKGGARQIDDDELLADVAGVMALERDFMRAAFGRDGGFITVQVSGDSMSPTLINGDVILVDTEVNRVKDSDIYVVRVDGDLLVKRVQRLMNTSLVLMSDNPAYKPETIPPDAVHALRVVGRMVRLRVR